MGGNQSRQGVRGHMVAAASMPNIASIGQSASHKVDDTYRRTNQWQTPVHLKYRGIDYKGEDDSSSNKSSSDIQEQSNNMIQTWLPKALQSSGYENPLLEYIMHNIIGATLAVPGPYGDTSVLHCDYVASGRPLRFIEEFIGDFVLPFYGNTHTTTSIVSLQTTAFREQARDIIKKAVNATEDDVVIFTGSGCTAAIHKIQHCMQLTAKGKKALNTTIIIGPFEHHSNILPWKEAGCEIIRVQQNNNGEMSEQDLERILKMTRERDLTRDIICALSAASNVTGITTDASKITRLAHKHGALCLWDYACGGPYMKIDMNPDRESAKDAVFISPHKFVGGPSTPGILIAKKKLFTSDIPHIPGGGTVAYVSRETHGYVKDLEAREEGGTPAIIESIRAGLVFQLKEAVGYSMIENKEHELVRRAWQAWAGTKEIKVLGNKKANRLPIFSFLVRHVSSGMYLHPNFVALLLTDLYGIQARGGCACAGPYATDLLNIEEDLIEKFTFFLAETPYDEDSEGSKNRRLLEIMKPGFTRLNLPYFYDDKTINFILEAVDMVAKYGWLLLPQYDFNPEKGSWFHKSGKTPLKGFFSLNDVNYSRHGMYFVHGKLPHNELTFLEIIKRAEAFFTAAIENIKSNVKHPVRSNGEILLEEYLNGPDKDLRWFLYPSEVFQTDPDFLNRVEVRRTHIPFLPRKSSMRVLNRKKRSDDDIQLLKADVMDRLKESSYRKGGEPILDEQF